jgi:hypothetical protein
MIFPPTCLLSEPDEIGTGDVVMVAYLAPTHTGEEAFRVVRVGLSRVAEAVGFIVVDPMESEASAESVSARRLIGIQRSLRRNAAADKAQRVGLVTEDAGERTAATLGDHDHDLPLA